MFRRLPWGAVRGVAPICWDSNDPNTVRSAFAARLFRRTPGLDKDLLKGFKAFVEDQVRGMPKVAVGEVDFDVWINSRKSYNQSRKDQIRQAREDLRGGPPTPRQCAHIDAFVKSESYPEFKYPRMINSRSDAWKAFAGPYISACEDIVYSYFPEFIKHTPVPERPAKIAALKKAGRRYFATDFTAFESHFVPEVMDACENVLLRHLLQDWRYADLVCKTNAGWNNMRTRTGVRARVKGRRMSGDLWTSLGNGFTNLMLVKYIAHLKSGVVDGFVEGDDGIFSSSVEITKEDYERLGFTIKIEEVPDPTRASFCGLVFADSGQIIRDPLRFVTNFGWTQSFIAAGDRIMRGLLLAKGLSAANEAGQCPIVGAIARRAIIEAGDVAPVFVYDGYHTEDLTHYKVEPFAPAADTRTLFAQQYGIPVETQLRLEDAILRHGDLEGLADVLTPHPDMRTFISRAVVVT